ncbi:hypothetical protein [Haloferula sp. A504]|uniref:hypothetical protein n=1 Tax=Haloferula sp. A504 TaxID=3373601 RepID=UPI0031C4EDA0|nr:hypothetical protein [Verrucomicrobiaceae bacterium E54]
MRLLLTLLVFATAAFSQDDLRFLSSTTYHDPATSTNHAYFMWQAENLEALRDLSLEVYAKPGQPGATAPFTRRGRMAFQTNVAVLEALLDSLPDALIDADLLEERIDGLFGSLLPADDLSLAMKVSGVLQVAQTDPAVFRRLVFFSRAHPFVGIAMGTGASFPLSTPVTTFELRSASGDEAVVEARFTLDLNNPPTIPEPGPPVHVIDESASGHLNAKIRWGIPDDLARKTALTYGFNLYRLDRAFAEGAGYHTTPPAPAAMTALLTSNPAEAALVNRVPLMPIANLSPVEAADLVADPDTAFITDDRGVMLDNATTPFNDGDAFYYFVAARDILGRPGTISDGTLVTICDRQRPQPPIRARVAHIHDGSAPVTDFLRVSWEGPRDGDAPDFYYVYRWENPAQMLQAAHPFVPADHRVSGVIPHDPAVTRYSFDDNGSGAPQLVPGGYRTTGDDGKTYWYSVRAVKNTACGPLYSGNSSPAWGVLRDRIGPNAAGASSVVATRSFPEVTHNDPYTRNPLPGEDPASYTGPGPYKLRITVTRQDPRIEGAILYRYAQDNSPNGFSLTKIGQKLFSTGNDVLEVKLDAPADLFSGDNEGFIAVARDLQGRIDYDLVLDAQLPDPSPTVVTELPFLADVVQKTTTITGGSVGDDPVHDSIDETTGDTNPVEVTFDPSNDAREYKLYKRIDGGALLLVDQGEVEDPAVDITLEDGALPANSSQVCYFVQYFDEHGNPSPLADLGCVRTTAKVDLPVPILARPEKAGTEVDPQVTLRWFSETEGVERFRVYIEAGDTPVAADYSPDLSPVLITSLTATATTIPSIPTLGSGRAPSSSSFAGAAAGFRAYQTGRVGGNFGDPAEPNQFEVTFSIASGVDYRFYIESVSPAGDTSGPSNTEPFTWSPSPAAVGPLVPWPARSLPPVDDAFISEVKAQYVENSTEDRYYPVVKIGEITGSTAQTGAQVSISGSEAGQAFRQDPFYYNESVTLNLYTSSGGETALPFVLYRYQVANEYFPEVSGDVLQVSPRIDRIRTVDGDRDGISIVTIVDPFFELLHDPEEGHFGVYVKDTQGAVRGATYKYVLVRFKDDGEIDRSFPTNELFIPFVDP